MDKRVWAVRGAIQIESDQPIFIKEGTVNLFNTLLKENSLNLEDLISIQFTITDDLISLNPATALRADNPQLEVPLFCMQEPKIEGSFKKMVRIMVYVYHKNNFKAKHIYLGEAKKLRPDL
ncbi:MAG: chorismate mutase [Sphaerochaetaceae bacterium]|jgi:chorismate mutase